MAAVLKHPVLSPQSGHFPVVSLESNLEIKDDVQWHVVIRHISPDANLWVILNVTDLDVAPIQAVRKNDKLPTAQ